MQYQLNPTFKSLKIDENTYIVGSRLHRQLELTIDPEDLQLLLAFSTPVSFQDAFENLKRPISYEEAKQLFDYFVEAQLITPISSKTDAFYSKRYDRQIGLFNALSPGDGGSQQGLLANARIALIGIGGVGSYVLYTLAAMGVGFVRAVDFDKVEESNLSRQILYGEDDVNKQKINAAKNRIASINKGLTYEFIDVFIDSEEKVTDIIKDVDFCILAADTPRGVIQHYINNACMKAGTSYIFGYSALDSIIVGPMVIPSSDSACLNCLAPAPELSDPLDMAYNQTFTSTLIDPYNALAGNFVALEVIKYITEFNAPSLLGKQMLMELDTYNMTMLEVSRDHACSLHNLDKRSKS